MFLCCCYEDEASSSQYAALFYSFVATAFLGMLELRSIFLQLFMRMEVSSSKFAGAFCVLVDSAGFLTQWELISISCCLL